VPLKTLELCHYNTRTSGSSGPAREGGGVNFVQRTLFLHTRISFNQFGPSSCTLPVGAGCWLYQELEFNHRTHTKSLTPTGNSRVASELEVKAAYLYDAVK